MKSIALVLAASLGIAVPAFAQEKEDTSEQFARVAGGAVYDFKMGVDGTLVSEEYMLTHVTCTDGSRNLRVLLPIGPEDADLVVNGDGPKSTLKKKSGGYAADFTAYGKVLHKDVAVKPVKDPKSQYQQQLEISLTVGDELWKAMRDPKAGQAYARVGTGGIPIELPDTAKFNEFLKSCGISPKP